MSSFDMKRGLEEVLSDANQVYVAIFLVQFGQPVLIQNLMRSEGTDITRSPWTARLICLGIARVVA